MRLRLLLLLVLGSLSLNAQLQTGSEVPISSAGPLYPVHGYGPARVGSNGTDFLAVWSDARANSRIYATRIDSQGNVLDHGGLRLATGGAYTSVASNGHDYLVSIATCGPWSVMRVGADGTVGNPVPIGSTGSLCGGAELASNGDTYLAVWLPGTAALLDRDGNIIKGPFTVGPFFGAPVVASNGRDYMVAGSLSGSGDVAAIPVSWRGDVGVPHPIPAKKNAAVTIASNGTNYAVATITVGISVFEIAPDASILGNEDYYPVTANIAYAHIAWSGSHYLITYYVMQTPATLKSLLLDPLTGTFTEGVTASGVPADSALSDVASSRTETLITWTSASRTPVFTIGSEGYLASRTDLEGKPVALAPASQSAIRLAANGALLAAIWRENGTYRGCLLGADGRPISSPTTLVQIRSTSNFSAVFAGTTMLLSWYDGSSYFAQRFTSSLQPVDPAPVFLGSNTGWMPPAVAATEGTALVAWQRSQSDSRLYGNYDDIYGVILTTNGPAITVTPITIAEQPNNDHAVSVVWNGSEFLAVWAHAIWPEPPQAIYGEPPDDLVDVRIAIDGRILDSQPRTLVPHSPWIAQTAAAWNGNGVYVAWQPGGIVGQLIARDGLPRSSKASTIAPLSRREPTLLHVIQWNNSYAVAWTQQEEAVYFSTNNITTIGSDGSPVQNNAMTGIETAFGGTVSIAATSSGIVIAYDRVAPEFGGVSRVFTRTTVPVLPRRRVGPITH